MENFTQTTDFDFDNDFDTYNEVANDAFVVALELDGYDSELERDFAYGDADLVDLLSNH